MSDDDATSMTSSRPYLLRGLHEWIVDNHMTPYIIVDANGEGVNVPRQFVENGKIVLNLSPFAVRDLLLENSRVTFSARFSGTPFYIEIPIDFVLAIYARENGQGMVFAESSTPPDHPPGDGDDSGSKAGKPQLKLVK
ncbi:MAG: ClpXP protease specificity-enhancing factor [Gammaproteobacteria bacterium]|nr:ClpXP protease specificity-enhancing factor [Gammaproteobacteria bacterium]